MSGLCPLAAFGALLDDAVKTIEPQVIFERLGWQFDVGPRAGIADDGGRRPIGAQESGRFDAVRARDRLVAPSLPDGERGDRSREARHRIADEILPDAQADRNGLARRRGERRW